MWYEGSALSLLSTLLVRGPRLLPVLPKEREQIPINKTDHKQAKAMCGQEKTSLREVTQPNKQGQTCGRLPDNSCINLEMDSNPGEKVPTLKFADTTPKNKTKASVGPKDLWSTSEVT